LVEKRTREEGGSLVSISSFRRKRESAGAGKGGKEREREREREKELCSRRHFFLFLALYLEKSRALFNNPPPLLLF
jgi:hypothetical protein